MAMLRMFSQGSRDRARLPLLRMGRSMMSASTTTSIWNGREATGSLGASPSCGAGIYEKLGQFGRSRAGPKVDLDLQIVKSCLSPSLSLISILRQILHQGEERR